ALLDARFERVVVGLRGVRKIVDLAHGYAVALDRHRAREDGIRRELECRVRPPRVHQPQTWLRVVRLNVLLEINRVRTDVADIGEPVASELTLDADGPLR